MDGSILNSIFLNFSLQYCIVLFCSVVLYFPAARASFEIDVPPGRKERKKPSFGLALYVTL